MKTHRVFVSAALVAAGIVLCCVAWVVVAAGPNKPIGRDFVANLLVNIGSGLFGALATFLLIDVYYSRREKRREERALTVSNLTRLMRTSSADLAAQTLDELRKLDVLDSQLRGRYLSYANFSGLDLRRVDFAGARMKSVNLQNADARDADFSGTTISGASLAKASRLRGARMPDGRSYDGRLCLPGDLEDAANSGIDTSQADRMAQFYGVSNDDYLKGQAWAKDCLAELRVRSATHRPALWWEQE